MFGLQRLFYGPLRPIEVEQLYEKAWFAITETCLAMTIFREEVGGWFFIMFVSLLIGKIWGWIGEGRVDIMEQQPPANPRLFHAQLSCSLLISVLFDFFLLQYSINTVLRHARPNMMVMFAFEFAVLTVASLSTAARYGISVYESRVIQGQLKARRNQIREEREQERSRNTNPTEQPQSSPPAVTAAANDDDIDSMDIDTPGWEEKARWVFYLELATGQYACSESKAMRLIYDLDFLKLVLYVTFFCVLCMFYGMPIHIVRDVALTIRSFYKRITDFVRYRQATKDMNARYPDATGEEVAREEVCIICREDIRPWRNATQDEAQQAEQANGAHAPEPTSEDRLRPKKLPCGHVLHFACLRSWLERQQTCPTCRRPVLVPESTGRGGAGNNIPINQVQGQAAAAAAAANAGQRQNVYQFGPLRIAFSVRNLPPGQAPPQGLPLPPVQNQPQQQPRNGGIAQNLLNRNPFIRQPAQTAPAVPQSSNVTVQLLQVEQQIIREVHQLGLQQNQLQNIRALQAELLRLRTLQFTVGAATAGLGGSTAEMLANPVMGPNLIPTGTVFNTNQVPLLANNPVPQLPPGMTLPPGWTVIPLRQVPPESIAPPAAPSGIGSNLANTSTTQDPNVGITTNDSEHSGPASTGPAGASPPQTLNPTTIASASGPETHPTATDLPQWGSQPPSKSSVNKAGGSDSLTADDDPSTPSPSSRDKGKGRAVTVEDGQDDID